MATNAIKPKRFGLTEVALICQQTKQSKETLMMTDLNMPKRLKRPKCPKTRKETRPNLQRVPKRLSKTERLKGPTSPNRLKGEKANRANCTIRTKIQ